MIGSSLPVLERASEWPLVARLADRKTDVVVLINFTVVRQTDVCAGLYCLRPDHRELTRRSLSFRFTSSD